MTFRGTKRLNWRSVEQYLTSKIQRVISEPSLEQKQPTRLEALEPRTLFTAVTAVDLFYNDSAYDDNNAAITVEDFDAVATDKTALKELDQAGFENYSNYHKGINGVMVEFGSRPYWAGDPTVDDFIFRTAGAGEADAEGDPFQWDLADSPTSFEFIPSGSNDGSGTVVMAWDDASAVKNGWLQITILPNNNTQLRQQEVYYFGSAVGETGDTEGSTRVNGSDYILARRNLHSLIDPAPIDDAYDINRDQKVDGLDLSLIRRSFTNFQTDLDLIAAPMNMPTEPRSQVLSHSEAFLRWYDQSKVETGYLITGYDSSGQQVYEHTARIDATGHLVEGLAGGAEYTFTIETILPDDAPTTLPVTVPSTTLTTFEQLTSGGGSGWYVVTLPKGSPTRGEAGYGIGGALSLDPAVPVQGLVEANSAAASIYKALTGTVTVYDYHTPDDFDFPFNDEGAYLVGTKAQIPTFDEVTDDFNNGKVNVDSDQLLVVLEDTYGFTTGIYGDRDYDDWYWVVESVEIPDYVNSTSDNDDITGLDGTGWTGEFIEDDNGDEVPEVTLRSYIQYANGEGGRQTATFYIPEEDPGYDGTYWTINESSLPDVVDSLAIDGSTQGVTAEFAPVIVVDGSGITFTDDADNSEVDTLALVNYGSNGLAFNQSDNAVTNNVYLGIHPDGSGTGDQIGLRINNSKDGVHEAAVIGNNTIAGVKIEGSQATGNQVKGSYVGVDDDGSTAKANGIGVYITAEASNNTIGTSGSSGGRNIISGNTSDGVQISGTNTTGNTVAGNYIGTKANGEEKLANGGDGVFIGDKAGSNIIGGKTADGYVISGNDENGVYIIGDGTSNNIVSGNFIGLNSDGLDKLGNVGAGVYIGIDASQNEVGVAVDGANIISGNVGGGVVISTANENKVFANYIGTDATGFVELGNNGVGVKITLSSESNFVGTNGDGTDDGMEGNLISGNTGDGVLIDEASKENVVAGNLIGTDVVGMVELANGGSGVVIASQAFENRVGTDGDGTSDSNEMNIISGNTGNGVVIHAFQTKGNTVAGNYIGVDIGGGMELGNGFNGIEIYDGAIENVIGTNGDGDGDEAERNVISGNGSNGVEIRGGLTMGNVVAGNYIGTSYTGDSDIGNTTRGIMIWDSASDNTVGTDGEADDDGAERNVISGNGSHGVDIQGSLTTGNVVAGNYIGVNQAGGTVLANSGHGVQISDFSNNNRVGTDGNGQVDGIEHNVISGNALSGVMITSNANMNTVAGNYIGTDKDANADIGNMQHGVSISSSAGQNTIGTDGSGDGNDTAERNIISGNEAAGVQIDAASNNVVAGNYIGTNVDATQKIANTESGVTISNGASGNKIGTDGNLIADQDERNIISGNDSHGVVIVGSGTNSNIVAGNYIGTKANGTEKLANEGEGVIILDGASLTIVGTNGTGDEADIDEGNVISGNNGHGISVFGSGTNGTRIAGNYIGINVNGTQALENTGDGVNVADLASSTIIGTDGNGTADGDERNIISGNIGNGVNLSNTTFTRVAGNYIGTDAAGTNPIANTKNGVRISGATTLNYIGTDNGDMVERNIISGNTENGVLVASSTSTRIAGNYIGLNSAGEQAIANGQDGVHVSVASSLTLIGTNGDGTNDTAERNVISGNSQSGVEINVANSTTVAGNYIGTDATGVADRGNDHDGVLITGSSSNNTIGTDGTGNGKGNVISGNDRNGVKILGAVATGNTVAGNMIGTKANGNDGLGNNLNGVLIEGGATGNTVGTDGNGIGDASERNVISDNLDAGVLINGSNSNTVDGNYIGVNQAGTAGLSNGDGVTLDNADSNKIGTAGHGNIISGNIFNGVNVKNASQNNKIQGNKIGTDSAGMDLGNGGHGVYVPDGTENEIGGLVANQGNTIAYNLSAGVVIKSGTGNLISRNSIFENSDLGIDLNEDGVTKNDNQDPDAGGNNRQNYPIITAKDKGANTEISGTLYSEPSTEYRIEFFSNTVPDPSGFGEGKTYLSSKTVNTDANGEATFTHTVAISPNITATATNTTTNDTSEFSPIAPQIKVYYMPTGQGTTGDLSEDNPDGGNGPDFEGGFRFFPDAADYATRTTSRNIVRIRAILPDSVAGANVYFRSFDVDDPSTVRVIDPSDDGRDNRGRLSFALDEPHPVTPSVRPHDGIGGYQGRLRTIGGAFAAEGATVTATTVEDMSSGLVYAEVELATSFNPGDNFRVVASLNKPEVDALDATNGVGTTGDLGPAFTGDLTDQLSIWRRLHIEQDVMDNITPQLQTGNATGTAAAGGFRKFDITTNITIGVTDSYIGGTLRDSAGGRFLIVGNTSGVGATVTVQLDVTDPAPPMPTLGAVSISVGDYEIGNETAFALNPNGTVTVTTDININELNQYDGGTLRTATGTNYRIISNTTGAASTVTVAAGAWVAGAGITLYEDEFEVPMTAESQIGNITAEVPPAGGQVVVTTDLTVANADEFNGGDLVYGGTVYEIVSHTVGANAEFTITAAAALGIGPLPNNVTVYGNQGAAVPSIMRQPSNDGMYDMLQETTDRSKNRLADAYIQPNLTSLDAFDNNDVTPWAHFANGDDVADDFRGQVPGGAARPGDYETDMFWNVYALAGFEYQFGDDGDPNPTNATPYTTTGGTTWPSGIIIMHREEIYERTAANQGPDSYSVNLAKTMTHEVAHTFDVAYQFPGSPFTPDWAAVPPGPPLVGGAEHRFDQSNIASPFSVLTPDALFYLHEDDIHWMRMRDESP